MREAARLWLAVENFKSIHPPKGRWGMQKCITLHLFLSSFLFSSNTFKNSFGNNVIMSFGTVGTMMPRRQVNDDAWGGRVEKENHDPVVAFSRPPPLSPFIGPLVALSLLQSWSKRDGNDD